MTRRIARDLKFCGRLFCVSAGLAYLQTEQQPTKSFVPLLKCAHEKKALRVAIIGSGIGGTSAAYFSRQLLGPSAVLDVYEKSDVVGGRAAIVEMNGKAYEAGASMIHQSNKYVGNFAEIGGLTKVNVDDLPATITGLYDGEEFVYISSKWKIISMFKLFWRYGFSLVTMNRFLEGVLKDFGNIYKLQDNGQCFETVQEMLMAMGGQRFVDFTQSTAHKVLADKGIAQRIINELATAISLNNYGQDMNINAFVALVSLAGAQNGKLWFVKGGNYQVCREVLQLVKANVFLNRKVNTIKKVVDEDLGTSYQLIGNNVETLGIYDAVILAAPLEVPATSLQCKGCTKWPIKERGKYQKTVTTFISGKLDCTVFGFSNLKDTPENILSDNAALFYRTISKKTPNSSEEHKGTVENPDVYKVFSGEILTEAQLNQLFTDTKTTKVVPWLAYPKYSPPEQFTPFVLDDGVFYVNAIERAASALEMSAIGGRNAALLCKKYLEKIYGEQASGNHSGK